MIPHATLGVYALLTQVLSPIDGVDRRWGEPDGYEYYARAVDGAWSR